MDCQEQKIITSSTAAIFPRARPSSEISNTALHDADASKEATAQSNVTASEKSVPVRESAASSFDLDIEKQEEYQPKPGFYSWVRWTALNTYRRLFSIVFVANLIAYIYVWSRQRELLTFINGAAANLLVCGLARQPLVTNSFYTIACQLPKSAPLLLRKLAAKVYTFAGVHSGTGVSCCVWYITFVGFLTYQYMKDLPHDAAITAVLVLAYLVMVLLCGIVVAAYPAIRTKYHDYFEWIHRFSGWAAILMFWPLLLTYSSTQRPSMGGFLVRQPTFWILVVLTAAIIQPWTKLRKVKVTPEKLSSHAIRLHFDFANPKLGQGISISRHPLRDWHSFASFTDRHDSPDSKFSLVVSKAGDFTGGIIADPPQYIWKRSIPVYGFGKVMTLYSRMILVTTGSGIGPCLSFLGDLESAPTMRVVWQTRTPQQTYGKRVIDLVHKMDPNPLILDTTQGGRIDMLPYVIKLYKEFNAEAVCVISNPKMTKHLVFELERRGILAMGPIFDS